MAAVAATARKTSSRGRSSVVLASLDDLAPGGSPGADKQFAATFTGAGPGDGVYTFARRGFRATPLIVMAGRDGSVATVNCI